MVAIMAFVLAIVLLLSLGWESIRSLPEFVKEYHTCFGWDRENLIIRYFARNDESWVFVPNDWKSFRYSKDRVIPGCWHIEGFPHVLFFYTPDGFRYLIRSGSKIEVVNTRDLW